MKHIIEKIKVAKIKAELLGLRFALPELVIGIAVGFVAGIILQ